MRQTLLYSAHIQETSRRKKKRGISRPSRSAFLLPTPPISESAGRGALAYSASARGATRDAGGRICGREGRRPKGARRRGGYGGGRQASGIGVDASWDDRRERRTCEPAAQASETGRRRQVGLGRARIGSIPAGGFSGTGRGSGARSICALRQSFRQRSSRPCRRVRRRRRRISLSRSGRSCRRRIRAG